MKVASHYRTYVLATATIAVFSPLETTTGQPLPRADAREESILAANVLLGGITAIIPSVVHGKNLWRAFFRGATGGLAVYAGKRLIAREGSWASWSGRQLAAIGASEIRNAEYGKPVLSQLVLPIGLVHVYAQPKQLSSTHIKIDLAATIATIVFSRQNETELDWTESLRNGSIVFNRPYALADVGAHSAGVIRVDDIPGDIPRNGINAVRSAVTAHETIHASQNDFAFIAWSEPVERALLDRRGIRRRLYKYVDFGLSVAVWHGLATLVSYDDRPWEKEAGHFAPGW